jgi:hypothetical protein
VTPDPIHIRWCGQDVRIRHDDPRLGPYSPVIAWLRSAMAITSEVKTLRLLLGRATAYDVRVLDDGSEVRLRRRGLG